MIPPSPFTYTDINRVSFTFRDNGKHLETLILIGNIKVSLPSTVH